MGRASPSERPPRSPAAKGNVSAWVRWLRSSATIALRSRDARNLIIVHANIVAYAMAYWLTNPLMPYLLKEHGAGSLSLGAMQSLFNLVQLAGGLVVGYLQDHYSGSAALSVTQLGSALVYVALFSASSLTMLYLSRLPTVLQQSMQVAQAYVSKIACNEDRAVALSRLSLSYALGMVSGSLLSSPVVAVAGLRGTAVVAFAISAACIVVNKQYLDPLTLSGDSSKDAANGSRSAEADDEEQQQQQEAEGCEGGHEAVPVPVASPDEGSRPTASPRVRQRALGRGLGSQQQAAGNGNGDGDTSASSVGAGTGVSSDGNTKRKKAKKGRGLLSDGDHTQTSSSTATTTVDLGAVGGRGVASYWRMAKQLSDVVVILALLFVTRASFEPVMSMLLVEKFKVSANEMGRFVAVFAASGALANVIGTPIVMRLSGTSEARSIQWMILVAAAAYGAIAATTGASTDSLLGFVAAATCLTMAGSVLYTLAASYITSRVPKEFHGRAIAMSHAVRSAVGIVGPLVGTGLYHVAGAPAVGLANAAVMLLARVVMGVTERRL